MNALKTTVFLVFCLFTAVTVPAQELWETLTTGYEPQDFITDIALQDDYLWCGTQEGVAKWSIMEMSHESYLHADGLPEGPIINVEIDNDGNVWFGSYDHGVCRYDGSEFRTFTVDDGLASNQVVHLAVAADGTVWAGSYRDGISRFDGETWSVCEGIGELAGTVVYSMAAAPDGSIWFGTSGNGLIRYDGENHTVFTEDDGLANDAVLSLGINSIGTVWVGGYGGGVSCWDGIGWTTLRDDPGLDYLVERTKLSEARVILKQIINLQVSYYTNNGEYQDFAFGEDCIPIGFTAPDKETALFTYMFEGSVATAVEVVDVNEDGDTDDGLTYSVTFVKGIVDGSNISWDQDTDDPVHCFVKGAPDGNLWAGTTGSGVLLYHDGAWQSFTTESGLADNEVHALVFDRFGQLWCGTASGLCRYAGDPATVGDCDLAPAEYAVVTNYPNPFNPGTSIRYTVPRDGLVDVTVYNMAGQMVRKLVSARMNAGTHVAEWDGRNSLGNSAASGVYFAVLKAGEYQTAGKMQLVR